MTELSTCSSLPTVSWWKDRASHNLNGHRAQDQGEIYLLEVQTHLLPMSCSQAMSACTSNLIEFSLLKKTNNSVIQLEHLLTCWKDF